MINRSRCLIGIVIFSLFTSSCIDGIVKSEDRCIKTFESYAYVMPIFDSDIKAPLHPWKKESQIPSTQNETWSGASQVAGARVYRNQNEIWVRSYDFVIFLPPKFDDHREFLIYKSEEMIWETVSAELEGKDIYVGELFVTSGNRVWGKNIWHYTHEAKQDEQVPILSVFNDKTKRFEYVPNILELPLEIATSSGKDGIRIILDRDDIFWIFAKDSGVFSFDTKTLELTTHRIDFDLDISDADLAHDGSIYLHHIVYYPEPNDVVLYQYFPTSNQLRSIKLPEEWMDFSGMEVDSEGNLWIGALGYRDIHGNWNDINSRFARMIERMPDGFPVWGLPGIFLISSDGLLWYMRYADTSPQFQGNAWYDPNTGEGCMFTNSPSKIIEFDGYMWLISDGHLYNYSIK